MDIKNGTTWTKPQILSAFTWTIPPSQCDESNDGSSSANSVLTYHRTVDFQIPFFPDHFKTVSKVNSKPWTSFFEPTCSRSPFKLVTNGKNIKCLLKSCSFWSFEVISNVSMRSLHYLLHPLQVCTERTKEMALNITNEVIPRPRRFLFINMSWVLVSIQPEVLVVRMLRWFRKATTRLLPRVHTIVRSDYCQ